MFNSACGDALKRYAGGSSSEEEDSSDRRDDGNSDESDELEESEEASEESEDESEESEEDSEESEDEPPESEDESEESEDESEESEDSDVSSGGGLLKAKVAGDYDDNDFAEDDDYEPDDINDLPASWQVLFANEVQPSDATIIPLVNIVFQVNESLPVLPTEKIIARVSKGAGQCRTGCIAVQSQPMQSLPSINQRCLFVLQCLATVWLLSLSLNGLQGSRQPRSCFFTLWPRRISSLP